MEIDELSELLQDSSGFHEYHICHNCPFRKESHIFTLHPLNHISVKEKRNSILFNFGVFLFRKSAWEKLTVDIPLPLNALFPIPSPQCPTREQTRFSQADLSSKKVLGTISNRCASSCKKVVLLARIKSL